jgi:hypothetical protein
MQDSDLVDLIGLLVPEKNQPMHGRGSRGATAAPLPAARA